MLESSTGPLTNGKKLPRKGPWTLESDDDGYVCIVGPRPEDNVLAEKFLSRQLVRAPGDPLVIVKFDAEGNKIDEFSLTSKLAHARAVDIFVRSVTLNQWSTLQAWMTPWPRGGMRYAWSAHSIYKVLGLVSYKKEPSKWAKYMIGSWRKSAAVYDSFNPHVYGGHLTQEYTEAASDPFRTGFDHTALSTFGVFMILAHAAYASSFLGGFRKVEDKEAAAALLNGLPRREGLCRVQSRDPLHRGLGCAMALPRATC